MYLHIIRTCMKEDRNNNLNSTITINIIIITSTTTAASCIAFSRWEYLYDGKY